MFCARCWTRVGAHERFCHECHADLTAPGSVQLADPRRAHQRNLTASGGGVGSLASPPRQVPPASPGPAAAGRPGPPQPPSAARSPEVPAPAGDGGGPASKARSSLPVPGPPAAGPSAVQHRDAAPVPDASAASSGTGPGLRRLPAIRGLDPGQWAGIRTKLVGLGEKARQAVQARLNPPQRPPASAGSPPARSEPSPRPAAGSGVRQPPGPVAVAPRPPGASAGGQRIDPARQPQDAPDRAAPTIGAGGAAVDPDETVSRTAQAAAGAGEDPDRTVPRAGTSTQSAAWSPADAGAAAGSVPSQETGRRHTLPPVPVKSRGRHTRRHRARSGATPVRRSSPAGQAAGPGAAERVGVQPPAGPGGSGAAMGSAGISQSDRPAVPASPPPATEPGPPQHRSGAAGPAVPDPAAVPGGSDDADRTVRVPKDPDRTVFRPASGATAVPGARVARRRRENDLSLRTTMV